MNHAERSGRPPAERRAAVRYKAALRVELWPAAEARPVAPSFYTTRDISTAGFHFISLEPFNTGDQLCFRIVFPSELIERTVELMGGLARCVRVEEVRGPDIESYGVGAFIEKTIRIIGDL